MITIGELGLWDGSFNTPPMEPCRREVNQSLVLYPFVCRSCSPITQLGIRNGDAAVLTAVMLNLPYNRGLFSSPFAWLSWEDCKAASCPIAPFH